MVPLFEEGRATPPLRALFFYTGLTQDQDGGLESVYKATQKAWRETTKHSGDIPDKFSEQARTVMTPHFEALGFTGSQTSITRRNFDFAAVGGAYVLGQRKRLAFLHEMTFYGLNFNRLVLLAGKRPANPQKETLEVLNKADEGLKLDPNWQPLTAVPPTEDKIFETVLLQSILPESWKKTYTLVDAPLRTDRPEKPDPSFEDTLRRWLQIEQVPPDASVLLVYSQPGIHHALGLARRILASRHVECVGCGAPAQPNCSKVLDSIAKEIYEQWLATQK
jgi:hypothetical protein